MHSEELKPLGRACIFQVLMKVVRERPKPLDRRHGSLVLFIVQHVFALRKMRVELPKDVHYDVIALETLLDENLLLCFDDRVKTLMLDIPLFLQILEFSHTNVSYFKQGIRLRQEVHCRSQVNIFRDSN